MTPTPRWMLSVVVMLVVFSSTTNAQRGSRCTDRARKCELWASQGSCITFSREMASVCPYSCRLCAPEADLTFHPPGVARDTAVPHPRPTQPRPNAGGAIGSGRGEIPPRPSITRPSFECGLPYPTTSTTNSNNNRGTRRRTRDSNPQIEGRLAPAAPNAGGSNSSESSKVFCGATVISDRFLITSATCVIDPNNPVYSVRLGALTTSGDENSSNSRPVDYAIKQIIVHPDFDPYSGSRYNDVALLETAQRIQFNEYVFPYCVSDLPPTPGTTVIGAGFGLVNETHSASHLQEADLKVVESGACEAQYQAAGQLQRLREAYPALLGQHDVLCAGFPGRGACKGDEGGPLFMEGFGGVRALVGIISFTGPCHKENILPGVYTSVAHHINFIDSVIYGGH